MELQDKVRYRVNFRIKPSDNLSDELDRLAKIISQKYKEDVRIYMKTIRGRR
jgi:hypothetical protein